MTYINIFVLHLWFSLRNDVLNHRDISCISFSNQGSIYFMINIYSDSFQLALKYLKDTESNIHNIIIITGDFNIKDSIWDFNFPFHSSHSDFLFDIADSFSLDISKPLKTSLLDFLTMITMLAVKIIDGGLYFILPFHFYFTFFSFFFLILYF